MTKLKGLLDKYFGKNSRSLLWFIVFVAVVYLIVRNISTFGYLLVVVMGFSAVVFIHECGHFILAKLSGIKVETFSIFLPPILLGVRRTPNGLRFRILPKFFPRENDESDDGSLSFTVGKKGKAGETEYRIGLIPVAGYVKMLGQEDTGADKITDDPRAFPNKPIGVRMAVTVAGVVFNVIAAIGILMMVYLVGINRSPAVVGGVVPNSPAERAGLKPGDEIMEIAGKSDNLDFGNILIAGALSDVNEVVALRVKHEDGSEEDLALVAEQMPGETIRRFGIEQAWSLTIAKLFEDDANDLYSRTGLLAGDRIKSVNGINVKSYWELAEIVQSALVPEVTLSAERTRDSGEIESIKSQIRLNLSPVKNYDIETESDLGHIYSIVPRLLISAVSVEQVLTVGDTGPSLQRGDIILAAGDVENPTFKELRDVTAEHEDKELSIKVLRVDASGVEETLTIIVKPKRPRGSDRALIGIVPVLDTEHPVVAKTITAEGGPAKLAIPRGATIMAVDGEEVSNFYDVIREISRYPAEHITIDWRIDKETAGDVALNVGTDGEFITVKSTFAELLPFENMNRLYKASGLVDAFTMSCKKSVWFIIQTYVTLKGLWARNISPEALSGPVGIVAISYKVVEQSALNFLYLLAFISANLAVINFLPIPIVDGGVFVLLIIEKIKGGPVSTRVQEIISYAGLILIAAAFLYLTYNDIVNHLLR